MTLNLVTTGLINGIQDRQGLEKCDTDGIREVLLPSDRKNESVRGTRHLPSKCKTKTRNFRNSQDSLPLVTYSLRIVEQK